MNQGQKAARKVFDGFVLSPRTFGQSLSSAAMGGFSLFNAESRKAFAGYIDQGIINEPVMSQATTGSVMMLSLFHELNSPLFKKFHFDPQEFLQGVGPALENFHNVSGALENQFYQLRTSRAPASSSSNDKSDSTSVESTGDKGASGASHENRQGTADSAMENIQSLIRGEEKQVIFNMATSGLNMSGSAWSKDSAAAVLNFDWEEEATKNPDSLAGQMSRMVTKELFQVRQLSAMSSFLLQGHEAPFRFQEDSCTVNNVALLSARACMQVEQTDGVDESSSFKHFESADHNVDPDDIDDDAVVAAQFEVLYDVTTTFRPATVEEKKAGQRKVESSTTTASSGDGRESSSIKAEDATTAPPSANDEPKTGTTLETMSSTIVSVATIQGFLNGGPEKELRWRLALLRPAYEFPGMGSSY